MAFKRSAVRSRLSPPTDTDRTLLNRRLRCLSNVLFCFPEVFWLFSFLIILSNVFRHGNIQAYQAKLYCIFHYRYFIFDDLFNNNHTYSSLYEYVYLPHFITVLIAHSHYKRIYRWGHRLYKRQISGKEAFIWRSHRHCTRFWRWRLALSAVWGLNSTTAESMAKVRRIWKAQ